MFSRLILDGSTFAKLFINVHQNNIQLTLIFNIYRICHNFSDILQPILFRKKTHLFSLAKLESIRFNDFLQLI